MIDPVEKLGEKKITEILQTRELAMLRQVKELLEKNNIVFFLACGTALGCVRHGGFIPWDDDIDIYIRGKDYERVRKIFETNDTGTLQFQDYKTTENYPYTFPKIVDTSTLLVEKSLEHLDYHCGVYIDIFPLYGVTDLSIIMKVKEKIRYLRYGILKAYFFSFSGGLKGKLNTIVKHVVSPKSVQKHLTQAYMHDLDGTKILIEPGVFGEDALIKSENFSSRELMQFEDLLMPVCKGYDSYLKEYYGDYMKLPPVEERVSRHHISRLEIPNIKELVEQ